MALVKGKSDTYRVAVTLLDIFFQFFPAVTSYAQELETMVKREFNIPSLEDCSRFLKANWLFSENKN